VTTVLSPVVGSSWKVIRLLVVAALLVAAASLAFVVGRVTVDHPTRTITVTRVVPASAPDLCPVVRRGMC
jgi:hypothetical protein